jgi:hypothetical protein
MNDFASPQASLAFAEDGLLRTPDDVQLLSVRADSLVMLHRFDQAIPAYERLLECDPRHLQSMVNLGCLYRAKDQFDMAKYWLDRAAQIDPDFRILIFARASLHTQLGENDAAIAVLERIADDIDAKFLLANLYLAKGDFKRGFELYHFRGQSTWARADSGQATHHHWAPFDHWMEARDKTVAVFHEGGLGDIMQLCRYLPLLATVARQITYYVPATTHRLLAGLAPNVELSSAFSDYTPDQYDFTTTDLEMPYHFRTTLGTIPNEIPYLHVAQEVVDQRRLPKTRQKRVGLCWSGGTPDGQPPPPSHWSERRSFDLATYAPLGAVPGIEFVSLQLGHRAEQSCEALPLTRVLDPAFDLLDTAAIIAQLDLVITVDTAIAHLAAAIGTPVWVLSRLDACWRWLRNQPDNPWYPGVLRVFGQSRYGDWHQPIAAITDLLRRWMEWAECPYA